MENNEQITREELESLYGQIWNTKELTTDYEVISFLAPFCFVKRRADNQRGTLEFIHRPRFYFSFTPSD